jgi:hypothetical protein
MNAALSDVFLANLPKAICETYEPIRMKQPNTVFLHMFDWFIMKYGKTTTEDREENRQRMAANWHPSDSFEPLTTRLFIGASYASSARYPMDDRDVIDIGLRVIKRCGMYSEEYKGWIARENKTPRITETIDSFKEYWADAIALVNQMSVPAVQHGYGMAAMDDDTSILDRIVQRIACTLWPRVRRHARIDEEPSKHHGRYARPASEHPAILHGCQPAAPTRHLRPSPTATIQQAPRQTQWWFRRWQRWRKLPTTTNLVWRQRCRCATTCTTSHALQALGELELLPYSWRQH